MIFQFTLTVPEAKRMIAKGIAAMPAVKEALSGGKIFLKGGTTVSAVSEELGGPPLRISGRISPRGTRSAMETDNSPHCVLFDHGVAESVDSRLEQVIDSLGPRDIAVLGANLIDCEGNAAMLAGSPLGGPPGKIISGLTAQGVTVLIACGLEKLFPGKIKDVVSACGRRKVDRAMGMAVGLMPVYGKLITEVEACRFLADVNVHVIARGGVFGAEGATTLVAEGQSEEVLRLAKIVESVKGSDISGAPGSLPECKKGSPGCRRHRACVY